MEKIEYLRKYNPSIEIIGFENISEEQLSQIPKYWIDSLSENDLIEQKKSLLKTWIKFSDQFQSTISYMDTHLVGLDLVKEGENFGLLYTLKNIQGQEVYYIGYNPLVSNSVNYFGKLPQSFQDIYSHLHNGWVYYASKSNGLLPIEDTLILGQEEWGILEEIDEDSLPFDLQNCVGVFDNGNGDFAAVDLESNNEKEGFIWWHTKAPKLNVEIWPVIDEWTKLVLKNNTLDLGRIVSIPLFKYLLHLRVFFVLRDLKGL